MGCGKNFHSDWINVDLDSKYDKVIKCNFLKEFPFEEDEFDVVYHSHVLEHLSKEDGKVFIKNCYRILKPEGIIRIVVPDLEEIVKLYLESLDKAFNEDHLASKNYDWILIELFDQMARDKSGGKMSEYLSQETLGNEKFVISRMGNYGKDLIKQLRRKNKYKSLSKKESKYLSFRKIFDNFRKCLLTDEEKQFIKTGQFRNSGEIHKWMYDRYSLKDLLEKTGFKNIQIMEAYQSNIHDWEKYELDYSNGEVRKPDSLFIEAMK